MDKQHFRKAVAFGKTLITTGDLDPVYIALSPLKENERLRTVLAYSCLYHLGAAAYIAQYSGTAYWDSLESAARNDNRAWPRGAERRHWRGEAAISAARWLRSNYEKPEQVVYRWFNGAYSPRFSHVSEEIRKTPSYGPWIAFKIADIMERCLNMKVDFSDCHLEMYEEPRRGAALLLTGDVDASIDYLGLNLVVSKLEQALRPLKAPPRYDRLVGIAEMETVLCKYKSHCNGHYPPGKDTREVFHALDPQRWGPLAARMKDQLLPYWRNWE